MKSTIINKLIFLLLGTVVLSSCKKSFLEVDPQGQTTEVLALTDPDAAAKLVGGVYNTLYFGGFGKNTVHDKTAAAYLGSERRQRAGDRNRAKESRACFY